MTAALALAAAVTLSATTSAVDVAMPTPAARPTWSDEFAGRRIDRARWRFDASRNAAGWFNHERQYYAAGRAANARVADNALVIEARHDGARIAGRRDYGGQAYSSAKLVARRPIGYGFTEVRARLPCGRGTWPAIWLLPATGTWPDAGEIDVMEMVGWDAGVVHATLHTALYNHRLGTQRGAERRVPDACTAWHRYQLDWRPHAITIGVDGRGYMRVTDDRPGGAAAWPFTRPFALILNLAVGGDWGGARGVDDGAFPQRMTVDYVRHWAARGARR